jgi:hypothetical protein
MGYRTALLVAALLQFLWGGAVGGCKRAFNPTGTYPDDCSTVSGPACFVYSSGIPSQLQYPDINTRTCYRTCHDDADMYNPSQCEASLTGVHNQNIQSEEVPISSTENITTHTIFSPNFNDPKDYRKSTICRYNVTCPEGNIAAYTFLNHTLETATACPTNSSNEYCVDYVRVTLLDSTIDEKTCGVNASVGQVVADGFSGVHVEFYVNREEEAAGFKMNIMCYDPTINTTLLPSTKRSVQITECQEVTPGVQRQVDSAARLRAAFPDEVKLTPENIGSCSEFTVREMETLRFRDNTLIIVKKRQEEVVLERVAQGVRKLAVSTRLKAESSIRSERNIQGYARLFVCSNEAYVDRLGIKPEVRISHSPLCDPMAVLYYRTDLRQRKVS